MEHVPLVADRRIHPSLLLLSSAYAEERRGKGQEMRKRKNQEDGEMDLTGEIPKSRSGGEIRALHCKPMMRPGKHKEIAPVADSIPTEAERACRVSERVVKPG